jgi:1,4-alpha-glucan branching enzyme
MAEAAGQQTDPVSREVIEAIVAGTHYDPHAVLGGHPGPDGVTIRSLRPLAVSVAVVLPDGSRVPMGHLYDGVFSVTLPGREVPDYRLAVAYADGVETISDDPYRHLPTVGEIDLHLIGEGRHEALWRVLGAHVRGAGVSFAVWAPNARGVRVIGEFNHWDGRAFPMRSLGGAGVWELFIPGIGAGMTYKYEICGPDGIWRGKADPLATATERPPATASVVFDSAHEWADADWLARRAQTDVLTRPMSIYEVHLGSWRPGLSYTELAEQLAAYVTELGFTHVEFLPVAEHPFGGSWGYQVTSYYAPSSRFGSPDDFRYLVDRLHQAGLGVIVDWVPAHFPRDIWALARFDGTPLYEHPDPRRGEHPDWGTLIFNYGRLEVRNFLVANAVYWLQEFHIDGLRVDAVASMLYLDYSRKDGQWAPNELGGRENLDAVAFLREVNATCYRLVPGITMIAEESTAWPGVTRPVHLGGLGFGLKWNMGWMHDTLAYLARDPVHRTYHHDQITFSMIYAFSENYVLPLSHDEVVHGKGSLLRKMAGDEWKQFAGLRSLLAYMWAHPGKQLLFMGSEFGQGDEWSQEKGLQWHLLEYADHQGVQRLVTDLNHAYVSHPALWRQDATPAGFSWIDANDTAGNTLSFLRRAGQPARPEPGGLADGRPSALAEGVAAPAEGARAQAEGVLACVVNFSGEPHEGYQVGLPRAGRWQELINTDAAIYGGSNVGNLGGIEATDEPWHGMPASAVIAIPPLGALWLAPEA